MQQNQSIYSRRDLFNWGIHGLGATALTTLLCQDGAANTFIRDQEKDSSSFPNFPAKAKRAIHICLIGGLSHVDSFDHKPELTKFHGKSLKTDEQPDIFFGQVGLLRKEDWKFKPRGKSGQMISDMFPHIAEMGDDLTILKSMVSQSANHTPGLFVANSGFEFNGYPSMGSWIAYGLGSESEELPAYVVLNDERGAPNTGASTWSSAFLPASNQGVVLQNGERPVRDLFPARKMTQATDKATRSFINQINQIHIDRTGDDAILSARLRSYQLAAKMQMSIPEVADINRESQKTQEEYGVHDKKTADMGRRCLLGRRLLEKGVRFVQLFSGGPIAGSPRASWDAHENVKENHTLEAGKIDKPVAALLKDLKQRGMLKDTLVLFTTEFGRTPFAQSAKDKVGPGRDHNRYAFSCWMAGAGLKPGMSVGSSDDLGWKATERPIPWHDFHATVLHLFGIDHEKLTYYHNGIQRRLTNVHGDVVKEILA